MSGLRRTTQVEHLSYDQIDGMTRDLAERINSMWYGRFKKLWYADIVDAPIAAMLANYLGVEFAPGDKVFSIYSAVDVDFAYFKKIYEAEQFTSEVKVHLQDLYQEQETFTRHTLPWKK